MARDGQEETGNEGRAGPGAARSRASRGGPAGRSIYDGWRYSSRFGGCSQAGCSRRASDWADDSFLLYSLVERVPRTCRLQGETKCALSGPDFIQAERYALTRLAQDLSPRYVYHCLAHTRDEVVPAVERLAAREGVSGADYALLRTAAWYYDIGFIESPVDHELRGIRIATAVLPQFGFRPADIQTFRGLILATRIPQVVRTPLEAILADADLDVLGRGDFWARNRDLQDELAACGRPMSEAAWYRSQLRFLQAHTYFTGAARALRDAGKRQHIAELEDRLAQSDPWLVADLSSILPLQG